MTAEEAARLFRIKARFQGDMPFRILEVGSHHIDVASANFLYPNLSVGDSSGLMVHRIPREEFEKASGLDLATIVPAELSPSDNVTFDSRWIVGYVFADIVILSSTLSMLLLCLWAVRRKWWWLPLGVLWAAFYCSLVILYSPGLLSHDLFHQRLMVEEPFPYLFAFVLVFGPVAALMVLGGILAASIAWKQSPSADPRVRLWSRRLVLIAPLLATALFLIGKNSWRRFHLNRCLDDLTREEDLSRFVEGAKEKASNLEAPPAGNLYQCRTSACAALVASVEPLTQSLARRLENSSCGHERNYVFLFVPIGGDHWLYASISHSAPYLDIRNPKSTTGYKAAHAAYANTSMLPLILADLFSLPGSNDNAVVRPLSGSDQRTVGVLAIRKNPGIRSERNLR